MLRRPSCLGARRLPYFFNRRKKNMQNYDAADRVSSQYNFGYAKTAPLNIDFFG